MIWTDLNRHIEQKMNRNRWRETDLTDLYFGKLCTHCFKFVNVKPKSCFDIIWKLWSALLLKPTWNWLNFDLCNNNLVSPFDVWRKNIQNMLDPYRAIAGLRTQLEIEIKHTSWQSGSWELHHQEPLFIMTSALSCKSDRESEKYFDWMNVVWN